MANKGRRSKKKSSIVLVTIFEGAKKWGHPGFEPGSPASYDCTAITGCFSRPKQAYYHYTNDPADVMLGAYF